MAGYCAFCQCGSVMVSQCRNAFSRHSSNHSGSPFFFEISRMISSFNPGGADSVSTSVTKPYLYSCLTNPSIVSVAVLIKSPEKILVSPFRGAVRARSVDRYLVAGDLKPFWQV